MKSFKQQIVQAIAHDCPSRKTSWKQSKEYNAMNKRMQSANSKLRRAEARLAGTGGCACSRACSRSWSPSNSSRSVRRRSRYSSPSPSRERSSRDRGREQSRARSVRRTDQFALDLNSAREYRNVSNARQGRRK